MPSIENVNRLKNAKETRLARILVHVAVGINMDQAADAGDDEEHHHAQGIELQAEVHFKPPMVSQLTEVSPLNEFRWR
jgi:hypothetical protein